MQKKLPATSIMIIFIGTFVIGFSLEESFAYEINYDSIGFKLKEKPTICVFEPRDPDLSEKEIEKLLKQTKIASSEWQGHLQNAVNYQKDKEFWELNYVEIKKEQSDADVGCTINLFFEKKPEVPVHENYLLGVAKLDPISEIWNITIYYLQTKLQYTTGYIGDQKFYWYEPYYGKELRTSDELGTVIRHEIGHALGLGHYESDDFLVNLEWSKGTKPAPSLMVPLSSESIRLQQILPKDIELMRSIYGENGFLPDSDVDDFSTYKAKMFIENELFEETLTYAENYIQSNLDEDILYYKGEALWGLEKYLEAENTIDKVLKINPENTDALYIKGKVLTKSKNYDKAIETFDKVLEIDSQHYKALSYKGKIFYEQDMYQEAGKYYFESYDINRYNVDNLNRIGILLKNVGMYEDAIDFYDFALKIEPYRLSVLYNKGSALYHLEKYEEAIEYFDKVLEIDPNDENALNKKALSLEALGELDKAKELFDKLEKIKSGNSNSPSNQNKEPEQTEPLQELESTPNSNLAKSQIPDWIQNNASWWVQGNIDDKAFVGGIQFLIKEGIILIPETAQSTTTENGTQEIPSWIKNNANWWSKGLISDDDFLKGIQFMVENGIIVV